MVDNTHIQVGTTNPIGRGVVGVVDGFRNAIEEINKYGGILTAFGDTPAGEAALAASLELTDSDQAVTVRTRLTNVQSLISHPYFVQLLNDLGQ